MKFTCTSENLSLALGMVGGVTGRRVNLPILSNILIDARESQVEIISTDLELAVRAELRAKVETVGSFTVPGKTLLDFVQLLGDTQVTLALEGNELLLTAGSSSTKIKGTPADEFPVIPEVEAGAEYAFDAQALKDVLQKAAFAAAKNDIRPELSGVYFSLFAGGSKNLVLAATDSYRLVETKLTSTSGGDEKTCIVPAKTVYEMIRVLSSSLSSQQTQEVKLVVGETQVALQSDVFELTSRLVEGNYPDYTQIIPAKFKTTALLNKDVLVKKIKAASLFTTTGVNAVSFDLNVEGGTVGVSSTSAQTGEHSAEVEGDISGEENSILLNHRYVLEGLGHISADDIEFLLNDGHSPCMFRAKGAEDFLYIVMPIRQ